MRREGSHSGSGWMGYDCPWDRYQGIMARVQFKATRKDGAGIESVKVMAVMMMMMKATSISMMMETRSKTEPFGTI